ncbi:MAG: InlB B-repeat-containing protein [Bacilli bacterium]|jgi:hypothetical protein|nr:InlB B-repeat-containing protein [Bacilli bacterium]NLN80148.1 starch-binding protein [Erysipelotrichia bacterium]
MLNKKIVFFLSLFTLLLSSCDPVVDPTDTTTPTDSSTISSTSSPTDVTTEPIDPPLTSLAAPVLVLSEEVMGESELEAVVMWPSVLGADYYEYELDEVRHNIYTTSLKLVYGQTVVVRAHSNNQEIESSLWSDPFTYYPSDSVENHVYQVPKEGYAFVYFQNTKLNPIQVQKGGSIMRPITPTKDYHLFDNWYRDPFYYDLFDFNEPIVQSTTIYAKWIASALVDNVSFWIKFNTKITAVVQTPVTDANSWCFAPLLVDDTWSEENIRVFKTQVYVNGTSAGKENAGRYLIMDGWDDLQGRTYWKDEGENFQIEEDGIYNIYFSVQRHWQKTNGALVNSYFEKVSSNGQIVTPDLPSQLAKLPTPFLNVNHKDKLVTFEKISGASSYEYQINNGQVGVTTANSIMLEKFDYITVRSLSSNPGIEHSSWAKAVILYDLSYIEEDTTEPVYHSVYFHGLGLSSYLVLDGDLISPPYDPSEADYIFEGWYESISYETIFDFTKPITKNTIVYAKFTYKDDVETQEYYELIDSLDNVYAKFKLNLTNTSFLEFYTELDTPSPNFTFYVRGRFKDTERVETYGSYYMAAKVKTNLYFSPHYIWDINTERASHLYIAKMDIYFTRPNTWSGDVYYYAYNTHLADSSPDFEEANWPGKKMIYITNNSYGQAIYRVSFDVGRYNTLIFNNGEGGGAYQTVSILLDDVVHNTQYYTLTGQVDDKGRLLVNAIPYGT